MKNKLILLISSILLLGSSQASSVSFNNKIGVEATTEPLQPPSLSPPLLSPPPACHASSEIKTRPCSRFGLYGDGSVVVAVTTFICSMHSYEKIKPLSSSGCCIVGMSSESSIALASSFGHGNVLVSGCLPPGKVRFPDYEFIPTPIIYPPVAEW